MKTNARRGYTLMELVIAILIIGIMASFAVPQYLKSVEGGKYDDAVGLVNQIGMTNRMFALDHQGYYVSGEFPVAASCACSATNTCASILANYGAVAANSYQVTAAVTNSCALVCCNYLGDQNWVAKPYIFYACDPGSGAGGGLCQATAVSAAQRQTNSSYAGYTSISPYNSPWGVWMTNSGSMTTSPTQGSANAPPPPTF
jgi:type IV pilus assembly protein PilE